jgi:hypothetical protein
MDDHITNLTHQYRELQRRRTDAQVSGPLTAPVFE